MLYTLKNYNKNKISILFLLFILILFGGLKNSIYSLNNLSKNTLNISDIQNSTFAISQNTAKVGRDFNLPLNKNEEIVIEEKEDKIKTTHIFKAATLFNINIHFCLTKQKAKTILYCPVTYETPHYIKFCSLKYYS